MKKRINWKQKAIEKIVIEKQISVSDASKVVENTYRKFLHRLRKEGFKDVNISRELYFSLVKAGVRLADIDIVDTKSGSVLLTNDVTNYADPEIRFNVKRLESFLDIYGDINDATGKGVQYVTPNELVNLYASGQLSFDELKSRIKEFKETSPTYLNREGYGASRGAKARIR